MPKEEVLALLDKYVAGDCTEEEKKRVEGWIQSVNKDSNEWVSMTSKAQKKYLKTLYDDVLHQAGVPSVSIEEGSKAIRLPQRRFAFGRIAAAFIVLVGLSGLLYLYGPAIYRHFQRVSYTSLSILQGQTQKVVLDDGTTVWLNGGSTLRYPGKFKGITREVFLDGEGFFEVARDEQRPFIIHAGETQTQVLGTSLNVRAYSSEGDIQVAVVSGKVEIGLVSEKNEPGKIVLAANQMATYLKSTRQLSRKNIMHAADYAGWRNGVLAFHHTAMTEVVQELRRSYDLKFIIENPSINQCEISGDFNVHQPVEQVIRAICLSIGAHYKINNNQITISGPGCE